MYQAQPFTGQLAPYQGKQTREWLGRARQGFHNSGREDGTGGQQETGGGTGEVRPAPLGGDWRLAPRACVSESQSRGGL
jgi:hypothetical protein